MKIALLWTAATLIAALNAEAQASARSLTFEQALIRAYQARGLDDLPNDALRMLESPPAFEWPAVRAEAQWSDVREIDLIHDSLLVSVDYPLLDGGLRQLRQRSSQLAAASFRERRAEVADRVFEETVDAVARLYVAQERQRILANAMPGRRRVEEMLVAHEISNLTAAQWQDEAIAAEAQLVDLEIQRFDAEARLKELMGDGTRERIEVLVDVTLSREDGEGSLRRDGIGSGDASPSSRLSMTNVDLARAARRPQLMLSAFGGVASLPGEDRTALFGMRVTLALPTFDAALRRREAEAQLEAISFERKRRPPSRDLDLVEKRIDLLSRAVEVAKLRGASVARLTSAGLRSEAALAATAIDVAKRESELLAARVERWRLIQLAR